jgi:hypothetical protein
LQKIQSDLVEQEAQYNSNRQNAERFKNFTQTKQVTKVEWENTNRHNTLCSNTKCQESGLVCHENCSLEEISATGDNRFTHCWAFNGNNCHQCKNGCDYTTHFHAKRKPVVKSESLE